MKEILGDYEAFVAEANKLIDQSGIARRDHNVRHALLSSRDE